MAYCVLRGAYPKPAIASAALSAKGLGARFARDCVVRIRKAGRDVIARRRIVSIFEAVVRLQSALFAFIRHYSPFYGEDFFIFAGSARRGEQTRMYSARRTRSRIQNYKTLPEMPVFGPKPLSDMNLTRCNHVQLPLSLHSLWPFLGSPRSPARTHSNTEFGVRPPSLKLRRTGRQGLWRVACESRRSPFVT